MLRRRWSGRFLCRSGCRIGMGRRWRASSRCWAGRRILRWGRRCRSREAGVAADEADDGGDGFEFGKFLEWQFQDSYGVRGLQSWRIEAGADGKGTMVRMVDRYENASGLAKVIDKVFTRFAVAKRDRYWLERLKSLAERSGGNSKSGSTLCQGRVTPPPAKPAGGHPRTLPKQLLNSYSILRRANFFLPTRRRSSPG